MQGLRTLTKAWRCFAEELAFGSKRNDGPLRVAGVSKMMRSARLRRLTAFAPAGRAGQGGLSFCVRCLVQPCTFASKGDSARRRGEEEVRVSVAVDESLSLPPSLSPSFSPFVSMISQTGDSSQYTLYYCAHEAPRRWTSAASIDFCARVLLRSRSLSLPLSPFSPLALPFSCVSLQRASRSSQGLQAPAGPLKRC